MFVMEQPITPAPAADSIANVLAEWNALYDAHNEMACLMLGSMTPELHGQFENYSLYEMIQELRFMFEKPDGVESHIDMKSEDGGSEVIWFDVNKDEFRTMEVLVLKQKEWVPHCWFEKYIIPDGYIEVLGCWNKDGDMLIKNLADG
nr:hypothetical protein [Tanacetum cinerariifolium]